jgi:hypothetical protein
MIKEEDSIVLSQLARTLSETESRLEIAYNTKDYDSFNELKKVILRIQKKILEAVK